MTRNSLASQSNLVFVYGTLRKDANHPAHKIYLNNAEFVGYAKVRGELYMIDYYPGLVLSETDQWVQGEVYSLKDETDWQRLDVYEACSASCALPHEYQRKTCWVELENNKLEKYKTEKNKKICVWTYVFIQPLDLFTKILSGDFLKLPL